LPLAAVAGATSRIRLAYGVMILPLRPVVWVAKEVASLQEVSRGRVVLGVGVGGDRHDRSWAAAGVARAERGRRTDAALAVLPDLLAGRPTDVGGVTVELAPGVEVPPIVVGGMADAAMARAVAHDGWFSLPLPPDLLAPTVARLQELARGAGRPAPGVTGSVMVAIDGDPDLPGPEELRRLLTDPDGLYGMPAEAVPTMLVTGGPEAVAERIHALGTLGAERVVVSLVAGSWFRQAELLAKSVSLVP
jgi:alkanesulfonate monooxygenase SsuD/methylene tetrahydromethanopterin reductase-like flavin-dependent oxidoreductase (luciferase family)